MAERTRNPFPVRLLSRLVGRQVAVVLAVIDRLGHALRLTWLPGFWRLCDAYDLSLGTPDTPENFPRRHGLVGGRGR